MIKLLDLITEDIIKDMMKQIGKNTLRYIKAKNFVKGKICFFFYIGNYEN